MGTWPLWGKHLLKSLLPSGSPAAWNRPCGDSSLDSESTGAPDSDVLPAGQIQTIAITIVTITKILITTLIIAIAVKITINNKNKNNNNMLESQERGVGGGRFQSHFLLVDSRVPTCCQSVRKSFKLPSSLKPPQA